MKYTILSADTGEVLGEVDSMNASGEIRWEVGKKALTDADVTLEGPMAFVRHGGDRHVFPARALKENQFQFATALGNFSFHVQRGSAASASANRGASSSIKSQIPGKILRILCKPGDTVEVNQPLLVIEAMKMENEVRSTRAGEIEALSVQEGQKVEAGELLLKFKK